MTGFSFERFSKLDKIMKTSEKILKFCEDHKLTEDQFFGREMIKGGLYLNNVTEVPEDFNPTVGGSLFLDNVTKVPEGFNPIVGENLYLDNVVEIPEGFTPIVGINLYLNNLNKIPEGFNPTVGGSLSLNSVTEIPEGFSPTVGINLRLNRVTEIPEGFDPTVGGGIFLKKKIICENKKPNSILTWQNGKYCSIDRIFAEVVSRKIKDNIEIFKLKKISYEDCFFAVVKGNLAAHGKNLKSCLLDLRFKEEERDVSSYKSLNLDSELSFEDIVICYRVITGACRFGVDKFIEGNLENPKEKYKIKEIIELTEDQYGGNVFSKFFNSKRYINRKEAVL